MENFTSDKYLLTFTINTADNKLQYLFLSPDILKNDLILTNIQSGVNLFYIDFDIVSDNRLKGKLIEANRITMLKLAKHQMLLNDLDHVTDVMVNTILELNNDLVKQNKIEDVLHRKNNTKFITLFLRKLNSKSTVISITDFITY